jgi:cephalosporin-C deacetylase-like acetyl esterase
MGRVMLSVRILQISLTFVFLVAPALCPRPSIAQIARTEVHPIHTTTPTDQQFLTGVKDTRTATIAGVLRIPRAGTDRLPAVILAHGSGGMGGNVDYWSQQLTASGISTFAIDYVTGRGIENTNADQGKLPRLAGIIDIYKALALLERTRASTGAASR